MNISVIICTHNPRPEYLTRVLSALQAQTLPKDQWELLLVDNASREPLAQRWDISWHPHARHLLETKTGLTHARLCGIAASQGELLVFVDDDNVLRADYLETSLRIAADYPWLGAWSGSCIGEFELEPPAELRPWLAGLVVEKLQETIWAKLRVWTSAGPAGAGLVLRRKQALRYRELATQDTLRLALDRSGKQLGSGGDGDMALCGFELGFGTGRFPELELTHLIPAQRLTLEYFEGIYEGFGFGGVILNALYSPHSISRPGKMQAWLNTLQQTALFVFRENRANRRIRAALKRGQLRAARQLERSGFFKK